MKDLSKHPCFNKDARHTYGRVHLPVAPECNIRCNYCNRKFDCVNESRPGVTSAVLSPWQAVEYLKDLKQKLPSLSVVGIAGPGDPMANPEETLETFRLVKKEFPEMLLCLSTNGVNLLPYIDELADLGVSHITITINSLNPETLGKIYAWVRSDKRVLRGIRAGNAIIEKQLNCIRQLKQKNILVKINTIYLPGYNDEDIIPLAKEVSHLGADTMNCIPLYPVKDTPFENIPAPAKEKMKSLRNEIAAFIQPMTHCSRCRADAAGLLGKDYEGTLDMIREYASLPEVPTENRPYVAVASYEGVLVNQHLGEAEALYIFEETRNGYKLIEQRATPESGNGDNRWRTLAGSLKDCRAILVSGVGPNPTRILKASGIRVIQMSGLIDAGLDNVYKGKILRTVKKADAFKCGQECSGNAMGCA